LRTGIIPDLFRKAKLAFSSEELQAAIKRQSVVVELTFGARERPVSTQGGSDGFL